MTHMSAVVCGSFFAALSLAFSGTTDQIN